MKPQLYKNRINNKIVYIILLGLITFIINSWVLTKDFYFLFDDIFWIKHSKYQFDKSSFFSVLPTSRYNNRPLRDLFFYICYSLFGLNYFYYYLVVVIGHILNTYLVLINVYKLLKLANMFDEDGNFQCAIICSLFFGIYPKNLMAVFWISGAANDLLCTTFALLCILGYTLYIENRKSKLAVICTTLCYFLAMRSKEATICLPIIIIVYEISICLKGKNIRKYFGYIPMVIYMVAYFINYLILPSGNTAEGQYETRMSIGVMFKILFNYIRMYFGLDDSSFGYSIDQYYTKIGNWGIIFVFMLLSVSILLIFSKKACKYGIALVALFIAVGFSMAPLLILPNIQHMLYFYFPSVFISVLLGLSFYLVATKIKRKISCVNPVIISLVLLVMLNHTNGVVTLRNTWIRWGESALSTVNDLESLGEIDAGTDVYIIGASQGANVFNYGPGDILRILFENNDMNIELIDEINEVSTDAPYIVLKYEGRHVQEIGRKE